MRLIYFILFMLSSHGYKFGVDGTVLDLDNVDTFSFKHEVDQKQFYTLETFKPNDGVVSNALYDGPLPVWSSEDQNNSLREVWAYFHKNVTQLVKLETTQSGGELYYRKTSNGFEGVSPSQFSVYAANLRNGSLQTNNQFSLNLRNNLNQRQLFSKALDVDDGVRTEEFTPATEAKLTVVGDGNKVVLSASGEDHYNKVTACLKSGDLNLLAVEGTVGGESAEYFFTKDGGDWSQIGEDKYLSLKNNLRPLDVISKLTLDLSNPDLDNYHLTKEFERDLQIVVYSPNPGYEMTGLSEGGNQLWSSLSSRAVKAFVVRSGGDLSMVRVSVKDLSGNLSALSLRKKDGKWDYIDDHYFYQKLKQLRKEASKPREGLPEGNETQVLDVLAPDTSLVSVRNGRTHGVLTKTFLPKDQTSFNAVNSGSIRVLTLPKGSELLGVVVYLKNSAPYIYHSTVLVGSEVSSTYTRVHHGEPVNVDSDAFNNFLRDNASGANFSTSLVLDFQNPSGEHLSVDEYYVTGLKATVVQADEGYYFRQVDFGSTKLFDTNESNGHTPYKVVGFKNTWDEGGHYTLLELETFFRGEFQTLNFSLSDGTWTLVTPTKFRSLFRKLVRSQTGAGGEEELEEEEPAELAPTPSPTHTVPEDLTPSAPHPVPEDLTPSAPHPVPSGPEENTDTSEESESDTDSEWEGEKSPLVTLTLRTDNIDTDQVSVVAGSQDGYYFKSFAPKGTSFFGNVYGPEDFVFDSRGSLLVSLVKFYYVYAKLVGAEVHTVSDPNHNGYKVFYYTHVDNVWSYSMIPNNLIQTIKNSLPNQDPDNLNKVENDFKSRLERVEKELRRGLKNIEKKFHEPFTSKSEPKITPPRKLSHKTKLYDEMLDFSKHEAPKPAEPEETPEELERRMHPYVGGDKVPVEADMVYFEISNPGANELVHTKNYTCMGLNSVDVTPVAGKFVHVVQLHGKRLWVSSSERKCTNLQLLYVGEEVVGSMLRVTTKTTTGKLKTGDEFDYLFLKDGELKKVNIGEFEKLANSRFQMATMVHLTKGST